ncbi:MAG: hypothetical protein ABSF57_05955 [Acidobacteriaceae bacterium]|jgi:hypothetical protein
MRHFWRVSVVVAACFLMTSGSQLQAQRGGGGGQMGGGQGGRGDFGGGQMGQMSPPVQGTVTAVTADHLTLKTQAGDSYDVTVTSTSRILKAGQPIKLSDVKPGDDVTARGTVDTAKKTVQAMMLTDVDAAMLAKATANMGMTYIIGRVTAIDADNLKLSILRTDNVAQIVALDDGTSFQRGTYGVQADVAAAGGLVGGMGGIMGGGRGMGGGRQGGGAQAATPPAPENITLADIKVGDSVMATGTLKGGAFTVLKMGVTEPAAPGAARRRGANDQPAPAAPAGQTPEPLSGVPPPPPM